MNGGAQVRQRDSIELIQWNLDRRALWQGIEVLKNAFYQFVMLSLSAPPEVCKNHTIVSKSWALGLARYFFSHIR